VGDIGRSPDYRACASFDHFRANRQPGSPAYDQIKLVGPGMDVHRLRLTRLEAIESHEQLASREEISLDRSVRREVHDVV
jgi:hypothetical protein